VYDHPHHTKPETGPVTMPTAFCLGTVMPRITAINAATTSYKSGVGILMNPVDSFTTHA